MKLEKIKELLTGVEGQFRAEAYGPLPHTIIDQLVRQVELMEEALRKYSFTSSWAEEYVGGPRLSFSGEYGEGYEIAKEALEASRRIEGEPSK